MANEKEDQAESAVGILPLWHKDEKKPHLTRSQERPYLVSHTQSLWLGQKMRIIVTIYKLDFMGNHKDCFEIIKLRSFLVFGQVPKALVQVSLSEGQFD